ncbi:MAG: DUF1223 domain-containing protein [Acidobacteriota bacterium]
MKLWIPTAAALLTVGFFLGQPSAAEQELGLAVDAPGGPVVVELFTSQGCSSCPPADRLFSRLEGDVIPLAFHVDYWNHLGWRDPFSDPRWSERQRRYGATFERGYVYTPQLVVNGRAEAVGSDRRRVRAMLDEAVARAPRATVELAVEPRRDGLAVAVDGVLDAAAERPAALLVAVTEGDFSVDVKSGENARRTLRHRHVVRELREVGRVAPGEPAAQALVIPVDPEWNRRRVQVVAFVQDPVTLEIHGAASWSPDA